MSLESDTYFKTTVADWVVYIFATQYRPSAPG